MSQSNIEKSNSVTYLGLLIDNKLNWSALAQYLSLQLAKCCSMLYQVQYFVTEQTLISNIIVFHEVALSYSIITWYHHHSISSVSNTKNLIKVISTSQQRIEKGVTRWDDASVGGVPITSVGASL